MQVLKDDYLVYNYNLDNIKNGIVYVIGGRASGRTTIVKDILIQKRGYPVGRIFITNDWAQSYYSNYCDPGYISVRYNSYLLKEVMDKQKKNNKYMRIIIFDDVLSSKCTWMEDENMIELLNSAKELNILAIFCFQFSLSHPKLIESSDQVFILSQMFTVNRRRLYEHYASDVYENFEDFETLLDHIFEKPRYNTVVIDKKINTKPTSVNEVVFKYLASNVGLDEYKQNHTYPTKIYKDIKRKRTTIKDSEKEDIKETEKENITDTESKESDTDSSESSEKTKNIESKKSTLKDIFLKIRGQGVDEPKRKIKIDLKNDNVTIIKDDKEIEITF